MVINKFILSNKESQSIEQFMLKHGKNMCEPKKKNIFKRILLKLFGIKPYVCDTSFTYMFTPTAGIGNACEIKCNRCGDVLSVTDYDCW